MGKLKKIGILGGTFNPPHYGHLILAKTAFKKLNLNKIIFIPCGIPALKKERLAPAKDRLVMTKLLIKNCPKSEISEYEINKGKRGKKSFTTETIDYLKRKCPHSEIYWIIGQDSLIEIAEGRWERAENILDKAKFIVAMRPGYKMSKRIKTLLNKVIKINLDLPFSATKIRKKIKKGEDVSSLLPPEILDYIKKKKIYNKTTD